MPIVIGSNIASIETQRQLSRVTADVRAVSERLSSGLRINHASDDAAGLAIASDLKVSERIFNQGVRNFNDGLALLNIADSSVEQLTNVVTRLKELSEQAASGTYGNAQRKALDNEAQALSKEYSRIVRTTTFNGLQLFSASLGQLRVQGGVGTNGGIVANLGGAIGTGTFNAPNSAYVLPDQPGGIITGSVHDVVLADINSDGNLDMVSAAGDSAAALVVNMGNGDGTFRAGISYQTGLQNSLQIRVGDLNNDGILDAIVGANDGTTGGGSVSIRLGNGDGSFRAASSFRLDSSNSRDSGLTLGDLNSDGLLDLVASTYAGLITVRLGTGTGSFGAAISYATPAATGSTVLGDFNGDGRVDLSFSFLNGNVGIMLGTGAGTFGTVTSYNLLKKIGAFPAEIYSLATGDLNGDGIADLAAVGYENSAYSTMLAVTLGNGDGTFRAASTYVGLANVTGALELVIGDLNGDGILDITTAGSGYGGSLAEVHLGNGNGSFAAPTSYTDPNQFLFRALAIGDLNGDGVSDIVAGGYDGNSDGIASIMLAKTRTGITDLTSFKLTSRADALQALTQFDQVIKRLSVQRGQIGAFESRIGTAVSTLQIGSENFSAAASRITDADFAQESANLLKDQILQQAATAILGQANVQPQIALLLISGR